MKKRVLIVEDELPSRMLLEHVLSNKYEVTCLANGLEAMQWLNAGNIADLVLTDLDMPYMSGIDLIYQLEAIPFHDSIPVIVLSSSSPDELEDLRESGAVQAIMSKPFNLKTLHFNISNSLDKKVA